jgi:peroxiredoxin Q/BCP
MAKELKSGDKAPAFSLKDTDGNNVSLSSLKGKWVILYFYPRDNTPGCTIEAKEFTDALPWFRRKRAQVIGVSPDSVESHCGFIEKQKLKIILLSDPDKKALKPYNAWGTKMMYGKKKQGVIRSTYIIGPKGAVQHVWHKVRVQGHVKAVKEKLKELQK